MAMPIRALPMLEGEVARRFIKQAEENLKLRGTEKIPEEFLTSYRSFMERTKKLGNLHF